MARLNRLHTGVAAALAITLGAATAGPGLAALSDAEQVRPIALDGVVKLGEVEAACTGIGQTRLDPKWKAYPTRLEFSDAKTNYLSDETVTVSTAAGAVLITVSCEGPWVLLKLPKGRYVAHVRINGSNAKPRSASFSPPDTGQARIVMQFPDA